MGRMVCHLYSGTGSILTPRTGHELCAALVSKERRKKRRERERGEREREKERENMHNVQERRIKGIEEGAK